MKATGMPHGLVSETSPDALVTSTTATTEEPATQTIAPPKENPSFFQRMVEVLVPQHRIDREERVDLHAVTEKLQRVISTLSCAQHAGNAGLDATQTAVEALCVSVQFMTVRNGAKFHEVVASRMRPVMRNMSSDDVQSLSKGIDDCLRNPNCTDSLKAQLEPLKSALAPRRAQLHALAFLTNGMSLIGYDRNALVALRESLLLLMGKATPKNSAPFVTYKRCLSLVNAELVKQPATPVNAMSSEQLWEHIALIDSIDVSVLKNMSTSRARLEALRNTTKVELVAREMRPALEKCARELASEADLPGSVLHQFASMKGIADRLLRRLGSPHNDDAMHCEVIKTALNLLAGECHLADVLQCVPSNELLKLHKAKPFVAGRDHAAVDKLLSDELKQRPQRLENAFQEAADKLISRPASRKSQDPKALAADVIRAADCLSEVHAHGEALGLAPRFDLLETEEALRALVLKMLEKVSTFDFRKLGDQELHQTRTALKMLAGAQGIPPLFESRIEAEIDLRKRACMAPHALAIKKAAVDAQKEGLTGLVRGIAQATKEAAIAIEIHADLGERMDDAAKKVHFFETLALNALAPLSGIQSKAVKGLTLLDVLWDALAQPGCHALEHAMLRIGNSMLNVPDDPDRTAMRLISASRELASLRHFARLEREGPDVQMPDPVGPDPATLEFEPSALRPTEAKTLLDVFNLRLSSEGVVERGQAPLATSV